jgi:hypothetical protein
MKADMLFKDIAQFVKESRALLEAGAIMELGGLDQRVNMLCEQVLSLSQEERLLHADRLQTLLKELSELGEALVAQRDKLGGEAVQLAQQKKANTAYRTAEASDNFDRDEE